MKCKYCGAEIDDDSEFCISCGEKIEKDRGQYSIPGIISFTIPIVLLTFTILNFIYILLVGYTNYGIMSNLVLTFFGIGSWQSVIIGIICLAGLIIGIFGLIKKRGSAVYPTLGIAINGIIIVKIILQFILHI